MLVTEAHRPVRNPPRFAVRSEMSVPTRLPGFQTLFLAQR
jgi:hypothetical protein